MGLFSVDAPRPRSLRQEARQNFKAQREIAPQQLKLEAKYRPRYAALDLQMVRNALLGPGGDLDTLNDATSGVAGLITKSRNADVEGLAEYGPAFTEALMASNPKQGELLDFLTTKSLEEAKLDSTMDPMLLRQVQQGTRQAQAARGLGYGNSDAVEEAVRIGLESQDLRDRRRRFGQEMIGQNQMVTGSALQNFMGRPSESLMTTQMERDFSTGVAQGAGPRQFDPFNPYAADLRNTNYNASAAARIATANNYSSMVGAMLSAL